LNRNYYYNSDNHSGGKDGREWGHSILSAFASYLRYSRFWPGCPGMIWH
jgi:hypothetical protein